MKQNIEDIIKNCLQSLTNSQPGEDELLFEIGVLDSYGMIEFISLLEKNFSINIEPELLTLDNFSSINKIKKLIEEIK